MTSHENGIAVRGLRKTGFSLLALVLAAATAVATPYPADAGQAINIRVEKVVVGDQPEGAVFLVHIACSENVDPPRERDIPFTGPGTETETFSYPTGDHTCVITEPEDGGADEVTIEPTEVTFDEDDSTDTFDVTVTNEFEESADPVETQPTFTG